MKKFIFQFVIIIFTSVCFCSLLVISAAAISSGDQVDIEDMPKYDGYDCIAGYYATNSDASGGLFKVGVYLGGSAPNNINVDFTSGRALLVADLTDASVSESFYIITSPFLSMDGTTVYQDTILANKLLLGVDGLDQTEDGIYLKLSYTGEVGSSTSSEFDLPGEFTFVVWSYDLPVNNAPSFSGFVPFYVRAYGPNKSVSRVSLNILSSAPYYPGSEVQLNAVVSGAGIEPGTPESTVYWYVHGNSSPNTTIDNDGLLTIANDETALSLDVEAISTYDSTKSDSVSVPVSYPLNLQITPSQTTIITSAKRQEIQFELLLPNGQPFDYTLIDWSISGADGQYFRIDDNGLLEILPGAPAGSVAVKYAYQHDTGNVSTTSAIVNIITQQEGIYDQLTPTPEQNDKADQMEDAIGNAADKLENNNSSLGQLTPTRPQINTNLELDQEQLLAVSPLVTNIWSINGLGRMISIVLVVATVAYIFFGKRDG